jgi:hypothetical protein
MSAILRVWTKIYHSDINHTHTREQIEELETSDPDGYRLLQEEAKPHMLINGAGDKRQLAYPQVMYYVNNSATVNGFKGGMVSEGLEADQEKRDGQVLFPEYQQVYRGFGIDIPGPVHPGFNIGGGNSRIIMYCQDGYTLPSEVTAALEAIPKSFDKLGARENTDAEKNPLPPTEEQIEQLNQFQQSCLAVRDLLCAHGLWAPDMPFVSDGAFGNVIKGKANAPRYIELWKSGSEDYMTTTLGKMYAKSCQELGLMVVLQNRSYPDQKTGKNHARQAIRDHNEANPENRVCGACDYSSSQCVIFAELTPGKIIRVATIERAKIDKHLMDTAYPEGWGQKKK